MAFADFLDTKNITNDPFRLLSTTVPDENVVNTDNNEYATTALLQAAVGVIPMGNANFVACIPFVDPGLGDNCFVRVESMHPVGTDSWIGLWHGYFLTQANSVSAANSIWDDADIAGDLTNYEYTTITQDGPLGNHISALTTSTTDVNVPGLGHYADYGGEQPWFVVSAMGAPYIQLTVAANTQAATKAANTKLMVRRIQDTNSRFKASNS